VVAWRVEVLPKVFTYMFGLLAAIWLVEAALSLRSGQWHALPALGLAVVLQGIAAFARRLTARARAAVFTAAALLGLGMGLPVLGFLFPVPFIVACLTLTLLALCVSQRFAFLALATLVLVILCAGIDVCFLRAVPMPAPLADTQHIVDPNHFGNWIRVAVIFGAVGVAIIGSVEFLVRRLTEAVSHNAGLFSSLEQESRDKIRAMEEREVLKDKVRRSDELHLLGLLSATVAHDFNNLLMVILGNAEAIKPSVAGQAREDVGEIERACERAGDLCRSLLTLAGERISADEVAELNRLVEEELPIVRRLVTSRVTVEWAPGPAVWVKCARKEMRQALLNLCANARDAMPQGGRLRVATARVERVRPGGAATPIAHACLSIADNGTGMDAATRDRIFEPFFTTKGKTKGTGLGMTVVSAAVERQGGFLELETELGRGTTFSLFFPLVEQPAGVGVSPVAPSQAAPPRAQTVLVVDDDEGSRKVLARYLQRNAYAVLTATDGQDALDLLARGPKVDLVISDTLMPRMGGEPCSTPSARSAPTSRSCSAAAMPTATSPAKSWRCQTAPCWSSPSQKTRSWREVRRLLGPRGP